MDKCLIAFSLQDKQEYVAVEVNDMKMKFTYLLDIANKDLRLF
mgnify:CR=1 FL=1